jgi:hypothetical protein
MHAQARMKSDAAAKHLSNCSITPRSSCRPQWLRWASRCLSPRPPTINGNLQETSLHAGKLRGGQGGGRTAFLVLKIVQRARIGLLRRRSGYRADHDYRRAPARHDER